MLHTATLILNYVLAHKDAILAVLGGSAGIGVLAQGLLHKINVKWQINNKPFSYTLVQVLTVISALSAYLATNASFGTLYPWLAVTVATVHRYLISPYYTKKVLPYLEYQASTSQSQVAPAASLAASVERPASAAPAFVS